VRAGQRIGKYVVVERIAVGGMAEVWAGHAEGPQGFVKPVALKLILESFTGDPELERLFINEARIAARLQHANIVSVFDFDKVQKVDDGSGPDHDRRLIGRYYIAMERVEGRDLRRIEESARRTGVAIPLGVTLYLAGEVLKGLRYVHERREHGRSLGLVHRDVSPHNVLVGYAGEVKLSDFGIAKARTHTARNTKTGNIRGKLTYASPEQVSGEPVDHRTDQFALGVTLWEIVAGRRLFDADNELDIINQVVRCAVPPLASTPNGGGVPAAVEAVLARMLAARPSDRFATTAEALSAVLALPAYTPDGAPLGDIVRALFRPATQDLPSLRSLSELPPSGPPGAPTPGLATTRTMPEVPPGAAGTGATASTRAARPHAPARPPRPPKARAGAGRQRTVLVAVSTAALLAVAGVVVWFVASSAPDSRASGAARANGAAADDPSGAPAFAPAVHAGGSPIPPPGAPAAAASAPEPVRPSRSSQSSTAPGAEPPPVAAPQVAPATTAGKPGAANHAPILE
jgi:serine/threonine-protein kinase